MERKTHNEVGTHNYFEEDTEWIESANESGSWEIWRQR